MEKEIEELKERITECIKEAQTLILFLNICLEKIDAVKTEEDVAEYEKWLDDNEPAFNHLQLW